MTDIHRIGDFTLMWGESLRWDDSRQRLYFVDCASQTLHWLEKGEPPLETIKLASLPTGLVLTSDPSRVVVAFDDGLHVVHVDQGTSELLTPYPEGLGSRANDATADLAGNILTGTLNLAPAPGSYWWYSANDGWRQLDDGISNANGPVAFDDMLVFADTPAAALYAYDYDANTGTARNRRVFADTSTYDAFPDGACADADGGVWSCLLGAGKLARYPTDEAAPTVIDATVELPSDVTFGGASLDRMFMVSIAVPIAGVEIRSPNAGTLLAIDGTGHCGRPEPRFHL